MASWEYGLESTLITYVGYMLRQQITGVNITAGQPESTPAAFPTVAVFELGQTPTYNLSRETVGVSETIQVSIYAKSTKIGKTTYTPRDSARRILAMVDEILIAYGFRPMLKEPPTVNSSSIAVIHARFNRMVGAGDTDMVQ